MNLIQRLFKSEEQMKKDWRVEASRKGGKNHKPDHDGKRETVRAWREEHPNGKKADCIRDTGLSKPTVLKWWEL